MPLKPMRQSRLVAAWLSNLSVSAWRHMGFLLTPCPTCTSHVRLSWARTLAKPLRVQDEIPRELAAKKAFLQGCDREGHPVLVVWGARHDMGDRSIEETKRFICYCLDNAIAAADFSRNPRGQILCLFDLSGTSAMARQSSWSSIAPHQACFCSAKPVVTICYAELQCTFTELMVRNATQACGPGTWM